MNNGRYVRCKSGVDGEEVDQWVERSLCLMETRPGCATCPNSQFEVLLQIRIGDQVVTCPRWESATDESERKDPFAYVCLSRAICLTEKPFSFCLQCPNSKPEQPPRMSLRWFEEEERQRKIERELDEELDE